MIKTVLISIFMVTCFSLGYSAEKKEYLCGIAIGYPPYQYVGENGESAGIDYEVTKAVFAASGLKVKFIQGAWDDVLFALIHKTGKVDLLCGAEMNQERKQWLDFSDSYYSRNIVIFTLRDSKIQSVKDLYGKIVTGDRHSYIEREMGVDKNKIRIMQTASKEESFQKLKSGEVVAVVAPLEVGNYIAKNLKIDVRIIEEKDPGSPVAFAVAKGDLELQMKINESLKKLIKDGTIDKILKKYSK